MTSDKIIWDLVHNMGQQTNCEERAVGCVIYNVVTDLIVSTGNNTHTDGVCDCDSTKTAIHAEINAIVALEDQIPRAHLVAYVNHRPCHNCAEALDKVVFEVRYRSQKGI